VEKMFFLLPPLFADHFLNHTSSPSPFINFLPRYFSEYLTSSFIIVFYFSIAIILGLAVHTFIATMAATTIIAIEFVEA